jgi:hypothetical protein
MLAALQCIMFTSDVSARGVDYPDVSLVIQVCDGHMSVSLCTFQHQTQWGFVSRMYCLFCVSIIAPGGVCVC